MLTKFKFTQKALEALPPHPLASKATDQEYSDTVVIGLKLLVGKKGNKRFLFRYHLRNRKCSTSLGTFGAISVDEARVLANQYKALVSQGRDPKQERDEFKNRICFGEFIHQHYLPHARSYKRSIDSDESKFKHYLLPKFGDVPLADITTKQVQNYHNFIKAKLSPATANRHLSLLHRIFNLAMQWGYLEKNVCTGINKFQENNKHQRFLNNEEIRNLFYAADSDDNIYAATYVKILLLTGVRRSEGLGMKWDHLQLDGPKPMWYVPHTKSGKSRYVILNPMAVEILKSLPKVYGNPYVFVGKVAGQPIINPIKAFKRMLDLVGIESNFRLHDLRHTHASLIINNGGTLYDVQSALAHANSSISERYAHLSEENRLRTSYNISSVVAGAIKTR
ncbi:MAG: tyrosine-type recombinase/integrase [Methylococcales bacterium]|nr:tyrosine-type recombinase/integrase [Methylococcales bacterium]